MESIPSKVNRMLEGFDSISVVNKIYHLLKVVDIL